MVRRLVVSLVGVVVVVFGLLIGNVVAGNVPSLGLDLQGGASVTMTPVGEVDPAALTVAVDIIRQRVDSLGVAEPEIIRPRTEEKFYTWTHYGIFFPLLPEPHRYLNIMILLGTPGALAFDHDDITLGDPRQTATLFSSTAAVDEHHRSHRLPCSCAPHPRRD